MENPPLRVRPTDDERDFFEEHSFSQWVHDRFEEYSKKTRDNNKQKSREYIMGQIVILGLGIIFMFWVATPRNFLSWIIIFSIGLFCCLYGVFNIFSMLKINPFAFYKKVIQNRRK